MTAPTRRPVLPALPKLAERARAERRARRRGWARRGAWLTGPLLVLGLLGWLVAASPVLDVEQVTVRGTERLSPEQVERAAAVADGTALALVDAAEVERRVRALPAVEDVTVTRGWPDTLRLTVVERTPVVAVLQGRAWALADASGTVFATSPTRPPGLVRLVVRTPGPRDPATRAALAVLADVPAALRRPVAEVRASSPTAVALVLRDGRQVVWGAPGDTEAKAAAVAALLTMPGTVFDVSAPGVVTRR